MTRTNIPVAPQQPAGPCCEPSPELAITTADAEVLAVTLKALADPTRLRLLSLIASSVSGEACICDLTGPVSLSQPTVSHHMRQLLEAGLITRQQRGKWAYYRLVEQRLDSVAAALAELQRA